MDPNNVDIDLRERIKELNCLYEIALLTNRYYDSIDSLLKHLVKILPQSWQYPEVTWARIVFKGRIFKSSSCKTTKWRQSSQIMLNNESAGDVTIFYLEERPPNYEGPFLKEERLLLDEVARRISEIVVRMMAERELQEKNKCLTLERAALQDANTALRSVVANIEQEKKSIYDDIQTNIDKIIMPILHTLELELPKARRRYVETLKTNLEEMTSPFINQVLHRYQSLTPTEVIICTLIRNGLRTRDIAELRGTSTGTINRHRENIRRKLNIANKEINLISYLQSFDVPTTFDQSRGG